MKKKVKVKDGKGKTHEFNTLEQAQLEKKVDVFLREILRVTIDEAVQMACQSTLAAFPDFKKDIDLSVNISRKYIAKQGGTK